MFSPPEIMEDTPLPAHTQIDADRWQRKTEGYGGHDVDYLITEEGANHAFIAA